MAVRLPVEIRAHSRRNVKCCALANSGFETDVPEILVPMAFAVKNLKLSPDRGKKVNYVAAGRVAVEFLEFERVVIQVVTDDRVSPKVEATLLVSENEEEIILNDKLVGELGIVMLNPGKGIWRFGDDSSKKQRESERH